MSLAICVVTAGIDAELLLAHEGFAGELEEDALVDGSGHIRSIISVRRRKP